MAVLIECYSPDEILALIGGRLTLRVADYSELWTNGTLFVMVAWR
jgi:hypothetical protein